MRALFAPAVTHELQEHGSAYVTATQDTPSGVLVTLQVRDTGDVLPWLLSWGGAVRVLEPASLQKRLAEEARRILRQYG